MKFVVSEHSKLPPSEKVKCKCCEKVIAEFVNYEMIPNQETCYKSGNIPVPNFGWLCSFECAEKLEKKLDIKFMRTTDGRIDYYEGEIK